MKMRESFSFLPSNLIYLKITHKAVRTGCSSYYLKLGLFSSKSFALSSSFLKKNVCSVEKSITARILSFLYYFV